MGKRCRPFRRSLLLGRQKTLHGFETTYVWAGRYGEGLRASIHLHASCGVMRQKHRGLSERLLY